MDTRKKLRKLRNRRRAEKRGKVKVACVLLGLWLAFSVFLVYAAERQAEAYRAEPSVVMGTLQDARRVWTGKHMELKVWIGGVECETDDGWLGWTYGLSDTLEGLEQRLEAQIGSLARAEYARLTENSLVLVRLNVDGVEYIDPAPAPAPTTSASRRLSAISSPSPRRFPSWRLSAACSICAPCAAGGRDSPLRGIAEAHIAKAPKLQQFRGFSLACLKGFEPPDL